MKITRKSVAKIIAQHIETNREDLASHNAVKALLESVEGKEVNHRTFNKKVLGEQFSFTMENSQRYIAHGGRKHLICYSTTNYVDSSKLDKYDVCHSVGAITRIEKLEALDLELVYKKFAAIQKHFEALRELFGDLGSCSLDSFHNPAYYDLMRFIYNDENRANDLTKGLLNNFHYIRTTKKATK